MDCTSCERMASAEADIKNLIGWQESQNTLINKVDQKVEGLKTWIMVSAVAAGLNLFVGLIMALTAWALRGGI